jgi:hypothetical protein
MFGQAASEILPELALNAGSGCFRWLTARQEGLELFGDDLIQNRLFGVSWNVLRFAHARGGTQREFQDPKHGFQAVSESATSNRPGFPRSCRPLSSRLVTGFVSPIRWAREVRHGRKVNRRDIPVKA